MKKKLIAYVQIFVLIFIIICVFLGGYAVWKDTVNHIVESRVEDELEAEKFCYLKEITHYKVDGLLHIIYYDKNTGIMYCKIGNNDGGVLPIYNEDGTIRVYKGE